MAVGLAPADGVLRSRVPEGPGPWAFVLVGKPTDESGFGGAAFASGELGEGDQRGAVQLPDPFLKRVLNVATYEAFRRVRERGVPCGFKDLGAGGIACATSELAAAGGCGAEIALDDAHRVERALPPEVLLCAETQERYCWVVPRSLRARAAARSTTTSSRSTQVHPGAGARVIGRATPRARATASRGGASAIVDCDVEAITDRPPHRAAGAARASAARPPRSRRRARRHARRAARAAQGRPRWARASTSSATTTARCRAARGCAPARATRRCSACTRSAPTGPGVRGGRQPVLVRGRSRPGRAPRGGRGGAQLRGGRARGRGRSPTA